MRIAKKLIIHTVIVAITAVFIVGTLIGVVTYQNAKNSMEQVTRERFISLRDIKADQIKQYFDSIRKQIMVYSDDLMILDATRKFIAGFKTYAQEVNATELAKYKPTVVEHYLGDFSEEYSKMNGGEQVNAKSLLNLLDDTSFALQYNYIMNNPYKLGEKSKLDYVADGTEYSKAHQIYHPLIRKYKEQLGFYDIFLVDSTTGKVVYTVAKELDFTISLRDKPYVNSGISKASRRANAATARDFVVIEDFSPYLPSYNSQAAFIAAPIFDESDKKIGVLIFQLSIDAINNIMTSNGEWQKVGFGETGESYLVGPDNTMRSMSRFFIENPEAYLQSMRELGLDEKTVATMAANRTNIGLQPINTVTGRAVIAGEQGFIDYYDYRNVRALSAYKPLNIPDLNWGIVSGIDADEALAPVATLAKKIAFSTILIMLLISAAAVAVGSFMALQISRPIERLCLATRKIADTQDLTQRLDTGSKDEIGDIATAVNGLITSFQVTFQETINSTRQMQTAADHLKQLAGSFSMGRTDDMGRATGMDDLDLDLINESGENLEELSARLQNLSRQFKIFEKEADRSSGW